MGFKKFYINYINEMKKNLGWRLLGLFIVVIFFFSGRKMNDLNQRLHRKALSDICVRGLHQEYTANWRDSCKKQLVQPELCNLPATEGDELRKYYLERIGDCLVKFPNE